MNLGVILADVTKFKQELIIEIESKIKTAKNLLREKCEDTFNDMEKLNEEMHKILDVDPTTINDFIDMNIYLQGDRIEKHFEKFEQGMQISNVVIDRLEHYEIEISAYLGQKLLLPSMLCALYELKVRI